VRENAICGLRFKVLSKFGWLQADGKRATDGKHFPFSLFPFTRQYWVKGFKGRSWVYIILNAQLFK
jgi:hypothetical protein